MRQRSAVDSVVVADVKRGVEGDVADTDLFPCRQFLAPVRWCAVAHRHPDVHSDLTAIATLGFGVLTEFVEVVSGLIVWLVVQRDPSVAVLGCALHQTLSRP